MSEPRITVRIVFVFSIFLLKMGLFISGVSAQGSLGRIRSAVRKSDSKPATREKEPQAENEKEESNNANSLIGAIVGSVRSKKKPAHKKQASKRRHRAIDNRDHHRRRQPRHDHGLYLSASSACYPPQVVEHVHVYPSQTVVAAPLVPVPSDQVGIPYRPGEKILIDETGSEIIVDPALSVDQPWSESGFDDWAIRMSAIYGSNFDQLSQGAFGLLIQPAGSLGLDLNVTTFRERGFAFRDHLWIGDVNLVFESVISDFRGRIGIGVNWLADSFGSDAGFNLTAGFDKQINTRWVASGEIDLGSIGDTDLFHGQLSIGRRIQNTELVFGYDYYNIGGTGIDGWFTGFRFRF